MIYLPRLNLAAQLSDDMILRFGYGSDIRHPNFMTPDGLVDDQEPLRLHSAILGLSQKK